jgi:hypothetical protein
MMTDISSGHGTVINCSQVDSFRFKGGTSVPQMNVSDDRRLQDLRAALKPAIGDSNAQKRPQEYQLFDLPRVMQGTTVSRNSLQALQHGP